MMLTRAMDTFINVKVNVKKELQMDSVINEDLNVSINEIPTVARKLSAFRPLNKIHAIRDTGLDYADKDEYGTLITLEFAGDIQPSEEARDRLNSMFPDIIKSGLMETGHYDSVEVTL